MTCPPARLRVLTGGPNYTILHEVRVSFVCTKQMPFSEGMKSTILHEVRVCNMALPKIQVPYQWGRGEIKRA